MGPIAKFAVYALWGFVIALKEAQEIMSFYFLQSEINIILVDKAVKARRCEHGLGVSAETVRCQT